jgi:hypothetical protein
MECVHVVQKELPKLLLLHDFFFSFFTNVIIILGHHITLNQQTHTNPPPAPTTTNDNNTREQEAPHTHCSGCVVIKVILFIFMQSARHHTKRAAQAALFA